MKIRKADTRGHAHHGWLESYHSFSFAGYYDPDYMGYSKLRVINEDRVAPGGGFAPHTHQNMEIISYVIKGQLEHKDSMGNIAVINKGDIQRMSAGSGVTHSEYNASKTEEVHFLQIWILPDKTDIPASYAQKYYSQADKLNQLRLVVSPDGRAGSVSLHQDVYLYAGYLTPENYLEVNTATGRKGYLHIVTGAVNIGKETVKAGDAVLLEEENIVLKSGIETEILYFDLPG